MSITSIAVKLIGLVLAIIGLGVLLAAIGINFIGTTLPVWWIDVIVGVIFLGAGIYIIRGGNVTV